MFPQQSLKKLAPFIVGGTYTVQGANGATVAVVRSTQIAGATSFTEEWALASGASATLTFTGADYGATTVTLAAAPDHLPWPTGQSASSTGTVSAQRRANAPAQSLGATFANTGGVRYLTTSAQVQSPAPSMAAGLPTQPAAGATARRTEVLIGVGGATVGHVYAEWDATQPTGTVRIWQVMTAASFAPGGVTSFAPGVPAGVQGALTLSSWYAAAVNSLGGASLTAISGTATRTLRQ